MKNGKPRFIDQASEIAFGHLLKKIAKPFDISRRNPVLGVVRALFRLTTDSAYRGVWRLRRVGAGPVFQPFNTTFMDRYPVIFGFAQSQLGKESDGRILSFGCSTGEEVFSLRRVFPRAWIKGVDINPGNIATCRARLRQSGDDRLSFEHAGSTSGEGTEAYDAIFCMAVLRHAGLQAPDIGRCDHLIRFEDFALVVEDFARCLRPGGLLVLRHSNFRFCDVPVSANFEPLLGEPYLGAKRPRIFGPDNRHMPDVVYEDAIFRKLHAD